MSAWSNEELDRIAAPRELLIAGLRADGTIRKPVIIWGVRVEDDFYVRSVNGRDAAWYRGTRDRHEGWISSGGVERDVTFQDIDQSDGINQRIDAAYRQKYGTGRSVAAITSDTASGTTLKLLPR